MGAGVIPVAYDETGEMRVLLGRERYMPQWKGSCRWSGFEGARKEGESMIDTAAREFFEESMGVPGPKEMLKTAVRAGTHLARIVLRIHSDRKPDRFHVTYVLKVPWDPTLPQKFHDLRMTIEHIDRCSQEWRFFRPSVLVSDDQHVGPVDCADGRATLTCSAQTSPRVLCTPWTLHPHDSRAITATITDDPRRVNNVVMWSRLRDRVSRSLVDHPSVHVVRDPVWNLVQAATVCKDYLEKDQIRWWRLEDLRQVMRGNGTIGTDRFRPYFLPVLQIFLDAFVSAESGGPEFPECTP